MDKKISYTNRDFAGLRQDLVNLTKKYYPELIGNTNDASIYSVLLDLNAAVADNLHFHIDRVWQETTLDFAQQKQSLYHIAKTYGLKIPGNKPSVALCDFSINVPVNGDKENSDYLGRIKAGAQVSGGGQVFETIEDIDFKSPFNSRGEPNRLKIPNFDSNKKLVSYTMVKREAVVNGVTRIYRRSINQLDQKPFFNLYLPEDNVLSVTSIIHKEGTNHNGNPTNIEFETNTNKWYEVKSLIEDKIFIKDPTAVSDKDNFTPGKYIKVEKRFITEFTPEGYFNITFGSGNVDTLKNVDDYLDNSELKVKLSPFINNNSLGETPKINTTLFIKYRIGGGKNSNIGVSVISSVDNVEFDVNGPLETVNNQVMQSLRVTNITPAVGGSDRPGIEEIRNLIAYNFSAQDRAVTLNDYKSIIENIPSAFGTPAKVNVIEEDNKVKIKLLSYDSNGKLTSTVSNVLKNNISEYLTQYRGINDYIEIETGEIIDLGVDIDVVVDRNSTDTTIIKEAIQRTIEYFQIEKRKMGDHLFVGDLIREISQIDGIINVTDIRIFNKTGGEYSTDEVTQEFKDNTTKEIAQSDMIVFMKSNQIFQIRFPNKDIRIRTKNLFSTSL